MYLDSDTVLVFWLCTPARWKYN
uniref:Uncharacterized protein n=1 Tax=Anguilla anguilla TaxID=7936 RepID=A0A0E9SRG9_ANGAN